MLHSLFNRVCRLPVLCRDGLADLWYRRDADRIILVGVTGVFFAVIAFIIYFVNTEDAQRQAALQRRTDLRCLAANVYHEARGEPLLGQYGVAEVTMNRVAAPRFPDSVCAVVHQTAAFSWTILDMPPPRGSAWQRAMEVAIRVYDGAQPPVVPNALYYHASRIKPDWARAKTPLKTIGNHVFYP